MVKVKINNESSLGSRLEHELSGKTFQTDAPVNSNGKLGSFFYGRFMRVHLKFLHRYNHWHANADFRPRFERHAY